VCGNEQISFLAVPCDEHQAGQQACEYGAQRETGGFNETSARSKVTLQENVRQRTGFNWFKGPMKMQR